nr:hypothetical protein pmam_107 [Pithovirus mammoth]
MRIINILFLLEKESETLSQALNYQDKFLFEKNFIIPNQDKQN